MGQAGVRYFGADGTWKKPETFSADDFRARAKQMSARAKELMLEADWSIRCADAMEAVGVQSYEELSVDQL